MGPDWKIIFVILMFARERFEYSTFRGTQTK